MKSRALPLCILALLAVQHDSQSVQLEDDPLAYYRTHLFPLIKDNDPKIYWEKAREKDAAWKSFTDRLSQSDLNRYHFLRDAIKREHEFYSGSENMVRFPGSATGDYYCHDFAWRPDPDRMKPCRTTGTNPANYPGKTLPSHVDEMMRDEGTYGWEEIKHISQLRKGDVITYHKTSLDKVAHSAVVEAVRRDARGRVPHGDAVDVLSKDRTNAIFLHHLGVPGKPNFFRDEFGKAGLRYWRRIAEVDEQEREPWTGAFWFAALPSSRRLADTFR